jgi:hypothetical protein
MIATLLIVIGICCIIGSIRTEPWGGSYYLTGIVIGIAAFTIGCSIAAINALGIVVIP